MKKGKGRRRLETLIRFMDGLPRSATKHFDMGSFFSHTGDHLHRDYGGTLTTKGLFDCGTTACAMGWAAACPGLRRQGLSLELKNGRPRFYYRGRHGQAFALASRFFEIDEWDCHLLFGANDDIRTPKQWARFARQHLKAAAD